MARIAWTWAGSSAASLPARRLTMISAGSPGCSRGMRKFSVTTAQSVARKKPNLRAKYFMRVSSPPGPGRLLVQPPRHACGGHFGAVRWVSMSSLSSGGLAYGSCSLGQPTALSVR